MGNILGIELTLVVLWHEMFLHVARHVEPQRKGEVCVHLFFEHSYHVEGVPHRVEAENMWQLLKACPFFSSYFLPTLRTSVHVVSFQSIFHSYLVQALIQVAHVCNLTAYGVEFLQSAAHVITVLITFLKGRQ